MTMAKHPFESHMAPWGEIVDVDVEIVPLVKLIWDLGLVTVNSCQEQMYERLRPSVFIDFISSTDLEVFLRLVRRGAEKTKDEQLLGALENFGGGAVFEMWAAVLHWWQPGQPFFAGLYFPRHHLIAVETALKALR